MADPTPGLGGSRKASEAGEDQLLLIADHRMWVIRPHLAPGDAEHAKSFATPSDSKSASACAWAAGSSGRGVAFAGSFIVAGQPQDILGGALDHQDAPAVLLDQHRDAPALEIEGDLVELDPAGPVDIAVLAGSPRRAGFANPGLEMAVEPGRAPARARLSAPEIAICRTRRIFASVSVPVLSVHSTSMLPRSWIAARRFTITCSLGHAERAARERDRDDHRQQLGRQPDGQRQGEEEALEQRTVEQKVDQQHEQDEEHGEPHDQHAELVRCPAPGPPGAAYGAAGADLAELCRAPRLRHHEQGSRTADARNVPMKAALSAPLISSRDAIGDGMLFNGKGFAGQQGLVDEEILGLHHACRPPGPGRRRPAARRSPGTRASA